MKFLGLIFLMILLIGCPAITRGVVENRSDNPIVIYYSGNYRGSAYKIPTNKAIEIIWSYGCITVVDNEELFFFDGSEIPVKYMDIHIFSTSTNIVYMDGTLRFSAENGEYFNLPLASSCGNA
jgi:hypothetical protein